MDYNSQHPKCLVSDCQRPSDHILCSFHLEQPMIDCFSILDGIKVMPSLGAAKSSSKNIQLARSLMAISEQKLCRGPKLKRIRREIDTQVKLNKEGVQLIEIDHQSDQHDMSFFSEVIEKGFKSSKNFQEFRPEPNKSVIAICSTTKEIIFFIPDPATYDCNSQSKLKNSLMNTFRFQPDVQNKKAKSRKVVSDKWIFKGIFVIPVIIPLYIDKYFSGLKWSAYENVKSNPLGVTEYRPLRKYSDSLARKYNDDALSIQLKQMTKVFKPVISILKRHENISKYLIPMSPNCYGASLGIILVISFFV